MVTVVNSAADYIEHERFKTLKEAKEYAKTRGKHCIVEIYKFVIEIN